MKNDMQLPIGMTCNDCSRFVSCVNLFGCKPTNTECDWSPSRFHWNAKQAYERALRDIRDAVLHGRHQLAEMEVDSDIINAVLGIIDDHWPCKPVKQEATP